MIELDYQNVSTAKSIPSEAQFTTWLDQFLPEFQDNSELTLRIVDEEEGQALNFQYRNRQYPTNVLSFPFEIPEHLPDDIDIPLLGDLVVCAQVVEREAKQQNKSLNAHWAHMLLHGCLHLLGYDHINDADAEEMEQLEIEILAKMGFPNPYIDQ